MDAAYPEPGGKSTAVSVMTKRLSWGVWLGLVLFFMMLFVPTHYQMVKAVILAMVLGIIVIEALIRGRIRLHPAIPGITLLVVVVGLIGLLRGAMNNTPGSPRVGTIYVLWPIVYTLLVAGAANEKVLANLMRTLVVATIAIGLFGLSYVLYAAG